MPRDDRGDSVERRSIPVLRSIGIAALACIARIHQNIDEGLRLR